MDLNWYSSDFNNFVDCHGLPVERERLLPIGGRGVRLGAGPPTIGPSPRPPLIVFPSPPYGVAIE